ncbi:MAG: hypothetical protein HHAS10_03740 [Candidatus Altimarinota bacterium]
MVQRLHRAQETGIINPSISLESREGRIQLAKAIGPVMCAIFAKIASAFDGHSRIDLPNGKALCYDFHDEYGVTFRCGAYMKVSIPYDFIHAIDEGTVEKMDQMIGKWEFLFNGNDIPPQLWCDNPHYDAKKTAAAVPKNVDKALSDSGSDPSTRGGRMLRKLLPERVSKIISDETSERGVPKLRQTEFVKFPTLFIKKRENI